jgi:FMN phosphatase YigB (HAD superfamily)
MLPNPRSGVENVIPYRQFSLERPMTLTLLLDLDDTCLGNSMDTFIPAYLSSLGDHLSEYVPPDVLTPSLLAATQQMFHNNSPDKSLKQVFDEAFYPAIGIEAEGLQDQIDSFYDQKFPRLKHLTQFRPEAVRLVDRAFERGYTVAIATNPLFPLTAILQRLEWAGLPQENYPFSLIPSYESFYFAKPNPPFFAEFLSRLGWPEGPVVMVGDDYNLDILPAQRMGLSTFWITSENQTAKSPFDPSNGFGSLSDLLPWLDTTKEDELLPKYDQPEAILAILCATPAVMEAFTLGLDKVSWLENPEPGEWSITEIMCHLRDVDGEVNLPRIKKVLQEQNPFLQGIDTDQWAHERLYYCQNGQEALSDFITWRIQLLEVMNKLEPEEWMRPARHAIFGPTNLNELASILVRHDRLHVKQAYESLGVLSQQVLSN